MNGKVSKKLRAEAEKLTVGRDRKVTRKAYRLLKKEYKRIKSEGQ